jgi:hypothetical protein
MNCSICFWVGMLVTQGVSAQGTLNFANAAKGVNARVTHAADGSPVGGSGWQAELLRVVGDINEKVGEPVPFGTGETAGYFFGGAVTIAGVSGGEDATFRIRAFETSTGTFALSAPVTIRLGGGMIPPANFDGLQSWTVASIRPILGIEKTANGIILRWSREFGTAVVETTGSLIASAWTLVPGQPSLLGDEWELKILSSNDERYFRLRLNQ